MRNLLFVTLFFSGLCRLQAQDIHIFAGGGIMNYQGDLQARRLTAEQAHPYATAGIYYEATEKLYLRAGLVVGKVSASDEYSKPNRSRNLSFSSQVIEFSVGAEYDIFNSYDYIITPYLYAAVAGFHFNPYTYDATNRQVYLQPLGTEGQGFGGQKKYSLTQLAIPFGGGIKIPLTNTISLRLEAGLRKLFTDYLDDVSTVYADGTDLLNNNGQKSVELAFRSDELNPALLYPVQGAIRGNPKSKDYYYTGGASISFRLPSGGSRGPGKKKLGCPVNIY